ncbi:hypothetical protein K450DRAFT_225503 [Umbelopsis ramanniana AG]|uniref:HECT-type E3 ubiquitin transferase n=1 Tax=Umbelopsis ramanniana AG TaxID=1314678 RepID=A0AAD5EGH9_UMBRA|nr:uncharacterized protein K450DRAFT_225503 [Umbelopsis ramanniana AG]KAI8582927.1 hypothetical protein K450DRAFT_225503 [Umbelopsis ramanniana AG]
MPDVDDVSSPSQQTSIPTSPLMSPSDDREGFLCLSPTNKDPRPSASSAQTSKINATNSANSTEISIHAAPRRRRSSNASSKLAAVPGNPLRQHGSDSLAPNYRETGRGVANAVNSQQYSMMQYRQTKERSQSCHEEENRKVSVKQIDAQSDKHNKVDRTRHRQSTVQKATTAFSLKVKQYFYQIHSGCNNSDCYNRLCANGSHRGLKLNPEGALVLAIHFASKPHSKLCQAITQLPDTTILHYFDTRLQRSQKKSNEPQSFLSELFTSTSSFSPIIHSSTSESPAQKDAQIPEAHSANDDEEDDSKLPDSFRKTAIVNMERPFGAALYDAPFPESNIQNIPSQVRQFWGNVSAGVLSAIGGNRRFIVPHNNESPLNELEYYEERNNWLKRSRRSSKYEKKYGQRNSKPHTRNDDIHMDDVAKANLQTSQELDSVKEVDVSTDAHSHVFIDMKHFKSYFDKMSSSEPDDQFRYLSNLIKLTFEHWDGLGNSFLLGHEVEDQQHPSINKAALNDLFDLLVTANNKNADLLLKVASESLEMLLTRMILNCDDVCQYQATSDSSKVMDEPDDYFFSRNAVDWCRSVASCMQWYIIQKKHSSAASVSAESCPDKTDVDESKADGSGSIGAAHNLKANIAVGEDILIQKLITILCKISSHKTSDMRALLTSTLHCFDAEDMSAFVKLCHVFMEDHYHSSPYKLDEDDHVIRTTKALELLYDSNCLDPNQPIVPVTTFYNDAFNRILDVKDEYRIWKRVQLVGEGRHSASYIVKLMGAGKTNTYLNLNENQRRTRLFLTTSSTSMLLPFPLMHEYQFSIFSYSFLLPPSLKRKILHIDAMAQMSSEYEDACVNHTLVAHAQRLLSDSPKMVRNLETSLRSATCPYLLLEITREHLIDDTWQQISRRWADLKKPLKVRFIGGGEEGMDQGGVQKEFFGVLMEQLIHSPSGLFEVDQETRSSWVSSNAGVYNESTRSLEIDAETRRSFEMFGVLMGLAIYNGVVLGLQFPKIFWKMLTCPNPSTLDDDNALFSLNDLEEGWPSLGKGLRQLLDWEQDDVEDIFCRSYEISYSTLGNAVVTIPLVADGENVPVTNENRKEFVDDYCRHFMYSWIREPMLAIRRGVWSVIGGSAVAMCTADEVEVIACGQRDGPEGLDLDMHELESAAEYDDGYDSNHVVIRNFWSIVHELSPQQKRHLLLFVTASDRIPVGGLKELMFVIQRNGPDSDRLPTALTCFSRLLLPEYSSREKLKNRLIVSIENAKGFGLV